MVKETYSNIFSNRIARFNLISGPTQKILEKRKCPREVMVIFEGIVWAYLNDISLTAALTYDEIQALDEWLASVKEIELFPAVAKKIEEDLGLLKEFKDSNIKVAPGYSLKDLGLEFDKAEFVDIDNLIWKSFFKR